MPREEKSRGEGFVLLCDGQGWVSSVVLDELGATEGAGAHWNLTALVDPRNKDKAEAFLHEVQERGAALTWEMNTLVRGRVETLNYFGLRRRPGLAVLASRAPERIFALYDDLMALVNRQAGELRSLQKERADAPADEEMLEEFMRVNNELVNVRRELTRKNIQLEQLLEERDRAQKLREDVELIMRHDLKGPLNPIINLPGLVLEMGGLDEEQAEFLKLIEESGYRMLKMINLSLDLYKMETGAYSLNAGPVDLLRVIEAVRKESSSRTAGTGITLQVLAEGRPPGEGRTFVVLGEELLCHTMLANLVENALDASPEDGLVRVDLTREEGRARIAIHNRGAVPGELRDRFFDKYATAGKSHGTGLGTYSARLIAVTQGGDIGFASSEEEGTTVTVTLPLPPGAG